MQLHLDMHSLYLVLYFFIHCHRQVLVVIFFILLNFFCCCYYMCDLINNVEAIFLRP